MARRRDLSSIAKGEQQRLPIDSHLAAIACITPEDHCGQRLPDRLAVSYSDCVRGEPCNAFLILQRYRDYEVKSSIRATRLKEEKMVRKMIR
jgi:hypothetical protein